MPETTRHLVVVLGDQLDAGSSALDGFEPAADRLWMAEVADESEHVWSSKPRTALFLSAMRHFAEDLRLRGWPLDYVRLDDEGNRGTLGAELEAALARRRPTRVIVTQPGDWRVWRMLESAAARAGLPLEVRDDRHFYVTAAQFAGYASGRKQLRMEYFYRGLRRRHGVLMDGDAPAGGEWNYDQENRAGFGRDGPDEVPAPALAAPDAITRDVLALVGRRFAHHPGRLDRFGWPVTRADALAALADFIERRLPRFGMFQDAMWAGEPWLYHSRLSPALNLKLLDPREVVAAAEAAYRAGRAPLAAVEGFIRQVLGWREYVRGIYWAHMPAYLQMNALDAHDPLPGFYWTADTPMACMRAAISQTLEYGYAHHIQRLMVTGLYACLLGVEPTRVHEWYLAVYVDAVEWAELPNTLGMSQHADGGLMASKPYVATGRYIQRMSNYCEGCRFDPAARTGDEACPFTTLYWDFLARHRERLRKNPRMIMQVTNLDRVPAAERAATRRRADAIRAGRVSG
jgi:deoxyribodipyrimidine photolyase-related protein